MAADITAMELSGYSELLTQEENLVKKYKCYASSCEDAELRKMCESMAQRHTQHYEAILQQMQ